MCGRIACKLARRHDEMAPGKVQRLVKEPLAGARHHPFQIAVILRMRGPGRRRALENQRRRQVVRRRDISDELVTVSALQRKRHTVDETEVQKLVGMRQRGSLRVEGAEVFAGRHIGAVIHNREERVSFYRADMRGARRCASPAQR